MMIVGEICDATIVDIRKTTGLQVAKEKSWMVPTFAWTQLTIPKFHLLVQCFVLLKMEIPRGRFLLENAKEIAMVPLNKEQETESDEEPTTLTT